MAGRSSSIVTTSPSSDTPARALIAALGTRARAAQRALAGADDSSRRRALEGGANAIRARANAILETSAREVEAARRAGHDAAFLDRLALDAPRLEATARGIEAAAALPDPLGRTLARWARPNGLDIARLSVPIGVIAVVFESRPSVAADAAGLCVRAGNAAILRAGAESLASATAMADALRAGLAAAGLPEDGAQIVPSEDRACVGALLAAVEHVDLLVPRGGKALMTRVVAESRVPVLKHLDGLCHTYVDAGADLAMARRVVLNAKMRRPGICGATETLLIDRRAAPSHLKPLIADLLAAGCEVRGETEARAADARVKPASAADWDTEYLAPVIAVRVVDGVDGAIAHIARHGTGHTEAIVSEDDDAVRRFLTQVDAAIVMHNASTQFADGGEFGLGAEIGISTARLHARGPVGAAELTTYKYIVRGAGQVRP
jgi:glutamate-5-semialdehyde dehydrogenase